MFQLIYTITDIQKSLGKVQAGFFDSAIYQTISISKYNPLAGSSYIKLPKELSHPQKGLINIKKNNDSECFKWCLVRYLNPEDHRQTRLTKADKDFDKTIGFKEINVPVRIKDLHKIEKKNSIGIGVFDYENKGKYLIYISK